MMEAKTMTALLVRTFDMELVPNQPDIVVQKLTTEPLHGLYAYLKPRTTSR